MRPFRACWGMFAAGLALAALAGAHEQPPTFVESAAVTAFDLVVEIDAGRLSSTSTRRGVGLDPADLALKVDGAPVEVAALHPGAILEKGSPLEGDDAWSVLVWLAADLSSSYQLRWAAAALAQIPGELTSLGEVEIVLADPRPRTLLEPTREPTVLETALSRLAIDAIGEDRLAALRHDYVRERASPTLDLPPAELGRAFAAEEERIALEHQDALLLAIERRRARARRRRLLILVSGGFEDSPPSAYGSSGEAGALREATDSWLRSVAASGWVTVPLLAPSRDHPIRGGLTIGKLRLHYGGPGGLIGFHGPWEEDRNPKRASAYVHLGRSLREQGRLEEAEEAFRRAIYHYYDDKKTVTEQGIAFLELGETLSELGERSEAILAWQLGARRLCGIDPPGKGRASGEGDGPSTPCAGVEPPERMARLELLLATGFEREAILDGIAEITSGEVLRDEEALRDPLRELAERPLLGFQLPTLPSGRLLAVELESRKPALELRSTLWVRSGAPERVASARLRHLLTHGPLEGDAGLAVDGNPARGAYMLELARSTPPDVPVASGPVRLSWAWLDGEFVHVRHAPGTLDAESGAWRLQGPPLPPTPAAAVMIELLAHERWGAAVLELGE